MVASPRTCRFCLAEEGLGGDDSGSDASELVAPCQCRGGQQWVHIKCLRRWQRSILVTQPTHPALIEEDRRITHCQVCLVRLSCPVLSRHEMMLQFTGAELASLVQEQSLIVSSKAWSDALRARVQTHHEPDRRCIYNAVHWGRSCYFIYRCGPKQLALSIPDEQNREAILDNIDSAGQLEIRGRQFRMLLEGPLGHLTGPERVTTPAPETRASTNQLPHLQQLYRAIGELQLPAEVMLQQVDAADRSDDSIRAVNLTKRISKKDLSREAKTQLRKAMEAAEVSEEILAEVSIDHFLGGPCASSQCIVMMPARQAAAMPPPGFKTWDSLEVAMGADLVAALKALQTIGHATTSAPALERPRKRQKVEKDGAADAISGDEVQEGQQDGLHNEDESDVSEWGVPAGELVGGGPPSEDEETEETSSPAFAGSAGTPGLWLQIFWGEARWQRTQLLGELARGDWGLCQAMQADMKYNKNLWPRLLDEQRPVYAPQSEMTRSPTTV